MNTWIFQGNPDQFKVDDYLRENRKVIWSIRQEHYVDMVQLGDIVYIWRSNGRQGNGGIIAKAKITGQTTRRKDQTSQYWIKPSEANEILYRVPMEVQETKLDGDHINREFLLNDILLKDLTVLRMSNNTNYLLDNKHASKLHDLWRGLNSNELLIEYRKIPLPEPVQRSREYFLYSEEQRSAVIYNFLFKQVSHRWLDEFVLKLEPSESRGYQSMGILHYLGLKIDFKGLFRGFNLTEAIDLLEQESALKSEYKLLYDPIVSSLLGAKYSQIKNSMSHNNDSELVRTEDAEGLGYPEGKIAFALHKKIERNSNLIKDAKKLFIKNNGSLYCEACKFDFIVAYGERGAEFIEGHHIKLVSEMKEGEVTKIKDIAMLCSNCHRMIHKKPLISVKELSELIQSQLNRHK